MFQKAVDFLRWLSKPPKLRDIWTYNGVWIFNGISASLSYQWLFAHILGGMLAAAAAGLTSFLLIGYWLYRMGFRPASASIISACGLVMAAMSWPTIRIDLSHDLSVTISLIAALISLPLFTREMENIRPKMYPDF